MKRHLALLSLALHAACMVSATAQNVDTLPALLGSAVDPANDKIIIRDASVSAASGALRSMTLSGLTNVPGLFTDILNRANHTGTQAHTTITGLGTMSRIDRDQTTNLLAVGTRSQWYGNAANSGQLSNGTTDLSETSRILSYATENADGIRIVYGNLNPVVAGTSGEQSINAITIKASIEYAGALYPVYFSGKRQAVLDVGSVIVSDPQSFLYLPKGATFYIRSNVVVASGEKWPRNFRYTGSETLTSANVDLTDSLTNPATVAQMWGPMAILGRQRTDNPFAIGILGDSISQGDGVTAIGAGPFLAAFDGTSLGTDWGKGVSHINFGLSGETAAQFGALASRKHRQLLLGHITHAIYEYGINDVRGGAVNFASIQATTLAIWNMLDAMGIKIWACTLTPMTNSGNTATSNSTGNAVRIAYNDWIRTLPAPLTGYFDTADACESSRNSGLWKTGHTTDGLHPNATGFAAYKAVVNVSAITSP